MRLEGCEVERLQTRHEIPYITRVWLLFVACLETDSSPSLVPCHTSEALSIRPRSSTHLQLYQGLRRIPMDHFQVSTFQFRCRVSSLTKKFFQIQDYIPSPQPDMTSSLDQPHLSPSICRPLVRHWTIDSHFANNSSQTVLSSFPNVLESTQWSVPRRNRIKLPAINFAKDALTYAAESALAVCIVC